MSEAAGSCKYPNYKYYYITNLRSEGTANAEVRDAAASAFAKQKQFDDSIKISCGEADSANGAAKTAKRFSDIFIISQICAPRRATRQRRLLRSKSNLMIQ